MKRMLPMRSLVLVVCVLAGCTRPNPAATCPEGFCVDSEFGFCDVDGAISGMPGTCIAVACTPGEFAACRGEQAITCNANGDDFDLTLCPFGCGEDGCLPCEAGDTSCSEGSLFRCNDQGVPMMETTCVAGCVSDDNPHCAYLEPRYAPDICDSAALNPVLNISNSGSFDPNLDTNCTGGVIEQAGTTALCVVHYGSIKIEAGAVLTVDGKPNRQGRTVMFVADGDLVIDGTLDVSAHRSTNGPGGGVFQSGGSANFNSSFGAGGAGGGSAGGSGGSATTLGGANNGGLVATNPAVLQALVGGAAASQVFQPSTTTDELGGGGGGGVSLVSCRGTLSVTGVVAANGGGGLGGAGDFIFVHGSGGGAGGNVVLQGIDVRVTGEIFANGGAGGSGRRATGGGSGNTGGDGTLSDTLPATAGTQQDGEGLGGNGGYLNHAPTGGKPPTNANGGVGGGGGSVGFLQTYTPEGIEPMLTPTKVSPAFQPNAISATR